MAKNNLKIFTASVVSETSLSKESKLKLFEFIQKEASDVQLKSLLLDGKIVEVDELSEEIVNERFNLSPYNDLLQELVWFGIPVIGAMVGALILAKRFLKKETRKCGVMLGNKRKICINKAKQKDINNKIKLLAKLQRTGCKSTRDPLRCKEKAEKVVIELKQKRAKLSSKLVKLASK